MSIVWNTISNHTHLVNISVPSMMSLWLLSLNTSTAKWRNYLYVWRYAIKVILRDWSLDMYLYCIFFCRLPAKYLSPQFKPIFAKNGSKENYQQYYKSNLITYVSTLRASSHFFLDLDSCLCFWEVKRRMSTEK